MHNKFLFNLTQDIIESDDVSDENIKRMCRLHVKSYAMLDMDQVNYIPFSMDLIYYQESFF